MLSILESPFPDLLGMDILGLPSLDSPILELPGVKFPCLVAFLALRTLPPS